MPGTEDFAGDVQMTCEEFAIAGLDLGAPGEDSAAQRAAREHMRVCPSCAALHENWQNLRTDLHLLGRETSEAQAPARVEMRLLQEFRTRNKTLRIHRVSRIAAWSLAAAAVLLVAVSLITWRIDRNRQIADKNPVPNTVVVGNNSEAPQTPSDNADSTDSLIASNTSDFTALPGSLPMPQEDATVVRVEMQRGSLGALGLTVNEERAADWIQVDLLVGNDGIPQAVRLPQESD
jgi:hypothetical protein